MKKLVLAMVSILMIALFIAFNYLLWDRENRVKELKALEIDNASNSASMSLQNREIKSIEEENNTLKLKISQLQSEQELLTNSSNSLAEEKDRLNRSLTAKNSLLNALKAISDLKELEQPVKKWVDAISAGEYDKAYEYEYTSLMSYGSPPGVLPYTENLKNSIKTIGLKSLKLDTARGTADGEIVLDVELEIKLVDKNTEKDYVDGINQRFIKLGYDETKKEFVILQISEL